jgi:hypothetical protein
MNEIWKDVKGYEGIYQVSNIGRVKNLKFNKEKILKLYLSHGYYRISLGKDGKNIYRAVSQLVAEAFLGHNPCGMKLVIDHINDIKTDNRVENLQIVTQRENAYKTQGNYTSQYKGVSWYKRSNKWIASIYINGKHNFLGYFTNEHEAHLTYVKALNNDYIYTPTN